MSMQQLARAEFVSLGGERRGYYAVPAGGAPFPAVLVFQEAFGVNDYVQGETRRLAENGYAALAPDLFGGETFPYDFAKVVPKLQTLTDEGMLADVDAGLAFLDGRSEVAGGPRGVVGFCMGGRLATLCALARPDRIAAAAAFYGGGIAPEQKRFFEPLLERFDSLRGELLLVYGAEDQSIAPHEHARIVERLSSLKKRYTLSVYPGAPHGFASVDRESYRREAAEAAWVETLALFARTLH